MYEKPIATKMAQDVEKAACCDQWAKMSSGGNGPSLWLGDCGDGPEVRFDPGW